MHVIYEIEALFILYVVVLSNLLKSEHRKIPIYMSEKNPIFARVGLALRWVLDREFYGSS
jgi:hypothetical protein